MGRLGMLRRSLRPPERGGRRAIEEQDRRAAGNLALRRARKIRIDAQTLCHASWRLTTRYRTDRSVGFARRRRGGDGGLLSRDRTLDRVSMRLPAADARRRLQNIARPVRSVREGASYWRTAGARRQRAALFRRARRDG